MIKNPIISVVMPAYNAEETIGDATKSILNQTFEDFELIIVNDGSTDNTATIIQELSEQDNRIKVITNKENLGCYPSRNIGNQLAKGEYIAVMDADDISLPDRFEKQINVLQNSPNLLMLGGNALWVDGESRIKINPPLKPYSIQWNLLMRAQGIINATCMFRRKEILREFKGYPEDFLVGQDRALFLRVSFAYPLALANMDDVIFHYIRNRSSISQRPESKQEKIASTFYHLLPYYQEIIGRQVPDSVLDSIIFRRARSLKSLLIALKNYRRLLVHYKSMKEIERDDLAYIIDSYTARILDMIRNVVKYKLGKL